MISSTDNVNVILHSDATNNLEYCTKIYTKPKLENCDKLEPFRNTSENKALKKLYEIPPDWIEVQNIQYNSTIIILTDVPKFSHCKFLELHGVISCEQKSKKYQLPLPIISIGVNDIINQNEITLGDILQGIEEAYLSIIASSVITPVKIILPDGFYRTLEGILQTNCDFSKVQIKGQEMMLVFNGNSFGLQHSMIALKPGENNVKLYTKNEDQMVLLIHYLYEKIPRITILNEERMIAKDNNLSYCVNATQSFFDIREPNEEVLSDLIRSLDKQMTMLEEHLLGCCTKQKKKEQDFIKLGTEDKYQKLRMELADMEKETDRLFTKVFQ